MHDQHDAFLRIEAALFGRGEEFLAAREWLAEQEKAAGGRLVREVLGLVREAFDGMRCVRGTADGDDGD